MARNVNIEARAAEFLADIRAAYGSRASSVILYGPAARRTVSGDGSGISFMVIMDDNSPSELSLCASFIGKWRKKGIAVPLFLTGDYIRKSLDTFPLEFMAMKRSYRVIDGEDALADLTFRPADVRAQCERELKGKLIHLRAEYLLARGDSRNLTGLAGRSLEAFGMVFAGALFLTQAEIPADESSLLDAVCKAYELDRNMFRNLQSIAGGALRVSEADADALFDRYVEELTKLSRAIDSFTV